MKLAGVASLVLATAACGSKPAAQTAPAPPPTTEAAPSPAPSPTDPLTPEQCAAQGGQVRGDIGDGQVACAPGERELGRVRIGIEGGVCCAPSAPPGTQE